MPFVLPWRNYVSGDLLYGLAGPRAEFAAAIHADAHHTIDQYEIATVDRGSVGIMHDPDFVAALAIHPKYGSVVADADAGWDLSKQYQWDADRVGMTALAKRKCKGGLNWITHNTFRHIHFCLDGLDLVAAASKNYNGAGTADAPIGKAPLGTDVYVKARSITGAELRWVYRNRNDPRVSGQIQFWKRKVSWATGARVEDGWEQCLPPWSIGSNPAVRAAWAAYVPTTVYVAPV